WGLFQACTKLCTIFSDSSPIDFAEPADVLLDFVEATRDRLGADWIGLDLRNDQTHEYERALSLGQRPPDPSDAWRPIPGPATAYGVQAHASDPSILQIPLLSGPFESARLRLGLHGDPASASRLSGIPAVVGLWSNIAFEFSSGSLILNGQFYSKPHRSLDGITVWHEQLGWTFPVAAPTHAEPASGRFRSRPARPGPLN
ncbi:MAG: hypothetical protein JNL97_07195, partial [Verrucomicrobiales bacterium]|nr:hypothetical protein [Verrucomicrobiales bacterium]